MTYFLKNGNTFRPTPDSALDMHKALPPGNFMIKQDAFGNFYFEEVDSFVKLPRYYGNLEKNAKRIFNTFTSRSRSTGVMLAGEKGSGKTLLSKYLSIIAAEKGMPTLLINAPWCGEAFNQLLQLIDQPCVVVFDEFEKIYPREHQEKILTLLDGVFDSQKLFIITCNDKWKIDINMRNRPGRVFYMLDFVGLEDDFIRDYCNDRLNDKSKIDQILKIKTFFDNFNFDMLQALVEEMNRYNEDPLEALKMLNVKPEYSGGQMYDVEMVVNGRVLDKKHCDEQSWSGNVFTINYYFSWDLDPDSDDSSQQGDIHVTAGSLKTVDSNGSRFTFEDQKGNRVILTRKAGYNYSWNTAALGE